MSPSRKNPTKHIIPRSLAASVEWRGVAGLRRAKRNARMHSARQIAQLAASIEQFGFTNPVLVDETGQILAGHGRVEAAKLLGLTEVPTLRIERLTEAQKRAYVIADNRIAELAEWDDALLSIELAELAALDFAVEVTGFSTGEIDLLIDGQSSPEPDPADTVPDLPAPDAAVSRPGDLWLLGLHRLLCANALDGDAYKGLIDGAKAQMVFTDPPYNVPIDGHVCGSGAIKHREFAMAAGEMTDAEFQSFLSTIFGHLVTHSVDGSIHYVCMDWRHCAAILTAAEAHYREFKNLCVWNKGNAGMGSFYRSKHELVFVFKNGSARHINNFGLGEGGRYRTNVWDYPGVNTLRPERRADLALHPTVKPVALVADAIRDCSKRNGLVLDPFMGSGTTLIAAERTGRVAAGIEIDPRYVDVAVRRWTALTARPAVLAGSDQTFEQVAAARSGIGSDAQPQAKD